MRLIPCGRCARSGTIVCMPSEQADASPTMDACTDAQLDVEFAYTTWQESCRDLHTIDQACRRPRSHRGEHAAGFGSERARWAQGREQDRGQ